MKPIMKRILAIVGVIAFVLAVWLGMALYYVQNQSEVMGGLYKLKHDITGYPQGEIVLTGSSSIQIWQNSERDLAPFKTSNIGISGSVVEDWFPLVGKLITPFNPKAVLVYVGSNDLHALFRTPEETAADISRQLDEIHAAVPNAVIYYVSVFTSKDTEELRPQDEQLNALVKKDVSNRDYARFVDVAAALLNEDGSLCQDVFLFDNVHLNQRGYDLWAPILRGAFGEDFDG